jgi:hypothetical protein
VTQTTRLIAYLRRNPGASSLEIIRDLSIVNTTGRISDIRAMPGLDVDCRRRSDGCDGYWLTEGHPKPAATFAPVKTLREEMESIFGGDR